MYFHCKQERRTISSGVWRNQTLRTKLQSHQIGVWSDDQTLHSSSNLILDWSLNRLEPPIWSDWSLLTVSSNVIRLKAYNLKSSSSAWRSIAASACGTSYTPCACTKTIRALRIQTSRVAPHRWLQLRMSIQSNVCKGVAHRPQKFEGPRTSSIV